MSDIQTLINVIREFLEDLESGNLAPDDCLAMIRETIDDIESKL